MPRSSTYQLFKGDNSARAEYQNPICSYIVTHFMTNIKLGKREL